MGTRHAQNWRMGMRHARFGVVEVIDRSHGIETENEASLQTVLGTGFVYTGTGSAIYKCRW